MSVETNLRIITKNHAADPETGFLIKSISKPYGRAMAMPPAWELMLISTQNLDGLRESVELLQFHIS